MASHALLYGKEPFLKEEYLRQLCSRLFTDASEEDLNSRRFRAGREPVSAFLDFARTAPFLGGSRLAVLENADEAEEPGRKKILESLAALPAAAHLVFLTEETNVKKDSFLAALAAKIPTIACHPPFERELPGWIEARAQKKGKKLEKGLAAHLVERLGRDLRALDGALEELALFAHPKDFLTSADAHALLGKNPADDVFRLADALLDGKKATALRQLDSLYKSGARGPEIVAALGSQIERYRKGSAAVHAGKGSAEVAEELRVPVFVRALFFDRLKKLTPEKLNGMMRSLLDCDEAFKTGQAGDRTAIERFIWTS